MKYIVLALVMVFVMLPVVASANMDRDLKLAEDTLKGENPSCPMYGSLYVAKTFKDVLNKKADWRTELSYTSDINSIKNDNSIQIKTGLEF